MNNSKTIIDLLTLALDHGISVFLSGEEVKLKVAKNTSPPPDLIASLARNKEEIRQFLRCGKAQEDGQPPEILPDISRDRSAPDKVPLSFSQQGLWIVDMLQGHSTQFNMPMLLSFKGMIDIERLEYTFRQIIVRHQVLRTVFRMEDGIPYQHILSPDQWQMEYSEDPKLKDKSALDSFAREEGSKPFDLSRDYMLRVKVVRVGMETYQILLVFHHIAIDGWSMAILAGELIELYKAASEERIPVLPELPIQYGDYARWQRSYYTGEVLNKTLKYWEEKLFGLAPIDLPTDYTRPTRMSIQGGTTGIFLEKELTEKLRELAQQERVTMFMLLLAAFKVLLYRYSGQEDICVGTPVANRTHKELDSLIGFFPNSLALRSDLRGNPSFKDFLAQVKETLLEGISHQGAPFEKVVDRIDKVRDMSRSPLFQVMFIYMNHPSPELYMEEGNFSVEHFPYEPARFDLTLYLDEMTEGMRLDMIYCRDIYTQSRVSLMLDHYHTLLQSISLSPSQQIGRLSIMEHAEHNEILHQFNNTATDLPQDSTLLHLFAGRALAHPDRIAVVCDGVSMTYMTLHQQSNRLAHYLRANGLGAESPVCVCMDRSIPLLVTLLGIMKAGGSYLPIDPDYPSSRLEYILKDSGARWVISNGMSAEVILPEGCRHLVLSHENDIMLSYTDDEVSELPGPDHLAYIIYTSGSTGKPKGAMIEHKGMLNHLFAKTMELYVDEYSSVLQNASQSFDISIWQFLVALINGGTTFIYQQEVILDSASFLEHISRDRLTHVEVVPSYLRVLLENSDILPALPDLKYLLVTGETLPKSLVRRWFEYFPQIPLVNAYGPTEASDDITHFIMTEPPVQDRVPVGHVLPNMQIYIFNQSLELCPVGVPGEIGVAGIGVGRGYLGNPVLTAEKFIANPFDNDRPYKLYRTGDLGYWLPDGNIAFIGRKDEQVKIRGHRIELGEIETAIDAIEGLASSCVVVKETANGLKYLVCYYLLDAGGIPSDTGAAGKDFIRQQLGKVLPDYMIPSRLIALDNMPLTSNGKIDRRLLTLLEDETSSVAEFEAPSTWIAQMLADIWRELIPTDKISVHDNFFESGGDSILVIQFVSRARKRGIRMQPRDFFEYQTIATLSEIIGLQPEMKMAEQGILTGEAGLLPVQQYLLSLAFPDISHYNQAILLQMDKTTAISHLREAIKILARRHDALRFVYTLEAGSWRQSYGNYEPELEIVEYDKSGTESLSSIIENVCERYQHSLDISKGELIRFVLIQTPDTAACHRLFIVAHQLVMDGPSWQILLRHLEEILTGLEHGKNTGDIVKSASFRSYSKWMRQRLMSGTFVGQQAYWQKIDEQYDPLPSDPQADQLSETALDSRSGHLPVDSPEVFTWKDIHKYEINLDKDATENLLRKVNKVYGTRTEEILLTVLASTVARWADRDKVLIGIETQDREHIAEEVNITDTIGWFAISYPVLLETNAELSLSEQVKSIKEQLRSVPDKGIGYDLPGFTDFEVRSDGQPAERHRYNILFSHSGHTEDGISGTRFLSAPEKTGICISHDCPFYSKWKIDSRIIEGRLTLSWYYPEKEYKRQTIAMLARHFIDQLDQVISSCLEREDREFTPSDYGLHGMISKEEFEEFAGGRENGGIDILKF